MGISTGTRFLLTHESNAHPDYKTRLLQSEETVVTTLYGLGWPEPHRVVKNTAIEKWCDQNGNVPGWLHRFNSSFGFTREILPFKASGAKGQRSYIPVLSSAAPDKFMSAELIECTALYSGEKIASISELLSAKEVVETLSLAF